jgi:hypothetical protein
MSFVAFHAEGVSDVLRCLVHTHIGRPSCSLKVVHRYQVRIIVLIVRHAASTAYTHVVIPLISEFPLCAYKKCPRISEHKDTKEINAESFTILI